MLNLNLIIINVYLQSVPARLNRLKRLRLRAIYTLKYNNNNNNNNNSKAICIFCVPYSQSYNSTQDGSLYYCHCFLVFPLSLSLFTFNLDLCHSFNVAQVRRCHTGVVCRLDNIMQHQNVPSNWDLIFLGKFDSTLSPLDIWHRGAHRHTCDVDRAPWHHLYTLWQDGEMWWDTTHCKTMCENGTSLQKQQDGYLFWEDQQIGQHAAPKPSGACWPSLSTTTFLQLKDNKNKHTHTNTRTHLHVHPCSTSGQHCMEACWTMMAINKKRLQGGLGFYSTKHKQPWGKHQFLGEVAQSSRHKLNLSATSALCSKAHCPPPLKANKQIKNNRTYFTWNITT